MSESVDPDEVTPDESSEGSSEQAAASSEQVAESGESAAESSEPSEPMEEAGIREEIAVSGAAPAWSARRSHVEGIRCQDEAGHPWLDALAGRASAVGLGCEAIGDAVRQTADAYLGDASAMSEIVDDEQLEIASAFQQMLESTGNANSISADSFLLFPDADLAIEAMITFARKRNSETSYRTIAIAGSDHGRTALCRSISGQPQLHQGFGPMVAGFDHVKPNDLKVLESAIDESTAAVLISPVDFSDSARPIDGDYLGGVRRVCDQRDLMLLIDESRLCFGATGACFSYSSLSDIPVDGIVVAGGLFAGLPGGMLIASQRLTGRPIMQSANYPMQRNVVLAMLGELSRLGLPLSVSDLAQTFAVAIAEAIAGFEFIRDIHATGLTIGIETDLAAAEIVSVAARNGLRIEPAGETSVRLQPPLSLSSEDGDSLLGLLLETMRAMEQQSAELST
ncbi:aminotransferase class III-fold pyridoxal phosphate-dependent enzyme [Novipirellula sp. SH528]|uniref:aminotransferase class III-fold pyridoxal phosphate-dependent enzyme n=1 Tax=Novipirellula sp. SH528 TaxID=3454466 RepID=UPI003FA19426